MNFDEMLEAVIKKMSFSPQEEAELRASWVFQKKGVINQYKENHLGTQPIRVIHNMLLYMFQNTYPNFQVKLQEMVDKGKLNPKIAITFAEESICVKEKMNTPRVTNDTRQISLHETFLSYLWCVSYSIYILYIEKVDYPKLNKEAGKEIYKVSQDEIDKAKTLFDYAKSLIVYFSTWDKDLLPNPEQYLAENRNYIEQTNMCYTEAVVFILAHELTHIEKHIDQLDVETPDSNYLKFEEEADMEAILHTIKGRGIMGDIAVNTGIIVGLLSMLYFSSNTDGRRHPKVEDRITSALEILKIDDDDPTWGMACVGIELWEEQFNLNFEWLQDPESPKQQYYHLIHQIKNRNN